MDVSQISLVLFIIITIIYFAVPSIGKPQLTLNDILTEESKATYYIKNIKSLAFYLGVVVVIQLLVCLLVC